MNILSLASFLLYCFTTMNILLLWLNLKMCNKKKVRYLFKTEGKIQKNDSELYRNIFRSWYLKSASSFYRHRFFFNTFQMKFFVKTPNQDFQKKFIETINLDFFLNSLPWWIHTASAKNCTFNVQIFLFFTWKLSVWDRFKKCFELNFVKKITWKIIDCFLFLKQTCDFCVRHVKLIFLYLDTIQSHLVLPFFYSLL